MEVETVQIDIIVDINVGEDVILRHGDMDFNILPDFIDAVVIFIGAVCIAPFFCDCGEAVCFVFPLLLAEAVAEVIKTGLDLLGIDVVERM